MPDVSLTTLKLLEEELEREKGTNNLLRMLRNRAELRLGKISVWSMLDGRVLSKCPRKVQRNIRKIKETCLNHTLDVKPKYDPDL